jgi:F-type H+-transporting ATPase subunit b
MLIDWFTVSAQAVNFLILVWLLKRFLYKPILDAIDAREARIAAELADADAKRADAKRERDEFEQKNQTFDQQRGAMLTKATDEANSERQRLMSDARNAAETRRVTREESLHREHAALRHEVTGRTQEEVFAVARRTLTDLADVSLEEKVTEVFIKKLQQLDAEAKSDFTGTSDTEQTEMSVRSAFDLPSPQRTALQDAINQAFSAQVKLTFETVPEVISGIEMTCSGRRISWSITGYLTLMEQRIGELLPEKKKSVPDPEIQPQTATS